MRTASWKSATGRSVSSSHSSGARPLSGETSTSRARIAVTVTDGTSVSRTPQQRDPAKAHRNGNLAHRMRGMLAHQHLVPPRLGRRLDRRPQVRVLTLHAARLAGADEKVRFLGAPGGQE